MPNDPGDRLARFPGLLGYQTHSSFIIAIHADWPVYPGRRAS